MPRKFKLKVIERPRPTPECYYLVRIIKAEKTMVTLEHLDQEQKGRTVKWVMDQPVYPDSLTAEYFRACGIENITIGQNLIPEDTIGAVIIVKYAIAPDGNPYPISFNPHQEKSHDHQSPEQSQPATSNCNTAG